MTSVLAQLKRAFGVKTEEAVRSYQGLVECVSNDTPIDRGEVEQILTVAGRSLSDLEQDVESVLAKRRLLAEQAELQTRVDAEVDARRQLQLIESQRDEELAAITSRHQPEFDRLNLIIKQAESSRDSLSKVHHELQAYAEVRRAT